MDGLWEVEVVTVTVLEELLHSEGEVVAEKLGDWLPVTEWPLLMLPLRLADILSEAVAQAVLVGVEMRVPLASAEPVVERVATRLALAAALAVGLVESLRDTVLQAELEEVPELLTE